MYFAIGLQKVDVWGGNMRGGFDKNTSYSHIKFLNKIENRKQKNVLSLYFELLSRDQSRGFGKEKKVRKGQASTKT